MEEVGCLRFGAFELQFERRRLLREGTPVGIGPRAFDVLAALAQRRERVVTKAELMDLAWPDLVVEENNLQVQISSLRKVLGPHALSTVPGRGYRFTAAVDHERGASAAADAPAADMAAPALGRSDLIGREADLDALRGAMVGARLLTIVGPGGVGKTSIARLLAAAARATWVELAPATTAAQAYRRIADALGVDVGREEESRAALLDSLRRTQGWIVLDNCEHLLAAVAELLADAVPQAAGVSWLLTSQHPLRVPGEQLFRLDSLAVPPPDALPEQLAGYGAVGLLVERVRAADRRFAPSAANLAVAADLCRQLDGMPLAIEMAAARVPAFGLRGVRERLARHLMSLSALGAAPSRQRTLRSALEWSHSLLTADEQAAFRRLAPFVGGFTAAVGEAQLAATADAVEGALDGLDALGSLVDKSLVQASTADPPRYRQLESARAFAFECLTRAGEHDAARAAHAQVMAGHFRRARDDIERLTELEWQERHVVERDNVIAALQWAVDHADADTVARLLAYHGFIENFTGVPEVGADGALALARVAQAAEPQRAEALLWTAYAQFMHGDFVAANALWPQSLALFRQQGDRLGELWALLLAVRSLQRTAGRGHEILALLAEVAVLARSALSLNLRLNVQWAQLDTTDDGPAGTEGLRDFIARCRRGGAFRLAAMAHANLSDRLLIAGDLQGARDVARALLQEGWPPLPRPFAVTKGNGASALVLLGDYDAAAAEYRSALRQLPNLKIMHWVLYFMAYAAVRQGRAHDAARIHGFVQAFAGRLGVVVRGVEAWADEQTDRLLREAVAPEVLGRLHAEGASFTATEVLVLAGLES